MINYTDEYVPDETVELLDKLNYPRNKFHKEKSESGRPHVWDVMKWLREKKNIYIVNKFQVNSDISGPFISYQEIIYHKTDRDVKPIYTSVGSSIFYEWSCNVAIAQACKWLLQHR